jgi:hypothetical protein
MTAESEQIRALLDQGLSHYGLGEVQRALAAWRQVLQMDPDNPRALEYIRFVEENWAPNAQQRAEPYRPDEGSDPFAGSSGEITVEATGETTAEAESPDFSRPRTPGPAEPPRAPVPESPPQSAPEQRRDPQSGFIQPVRPQVNIWGDLYAAEGKSSPAPPQPPPAEPAAATPQPAEPPEPAAPADPAAPLAADPWGAPADAPAAGPADSGVWERPPELAPEPAASGEAEADERVEQIRSSTLPARPDSETEGAPAAEPAQPIPEPAAKASPPEPVRPTPEPAATAPPPEPKPASGPQPIESTPAGGADAPAAVDGWGASLGESAAPEPDKKRVVIDPTPPFSEASSEPGAADRFGPDTGPAAAGAGSALDLVGGEEEPAADPVVEPEVTTGIDSWMAGARDLLELDDFSGAVELLDKVLAERPDHAEAARLREEAEAELVKMYSSKVGDLDAVPRVRMASDEIIWLNLDHRAGFVLSMIDGHICYEDILSVTGLPRLEGLRILAQLVQEKVIAAD